MHEATKATTTAAAAAAAASLASASVKVAGGFPYSSMLPKEEIRDLREREKV